MASHEDLARVRLLVPSASVSCSHKTGLAWAAGVLAGVEAGCCTACVTFLVACSASSCRERQRSLMRAGLGSHGPGLSAF